MFTLHSKSKTGEVYPETYQQEGPNFKGFILRVEVLDGKYEGAAVMPQTLQGPYFPTFIDAPSVEKDKQHYEVRFSYGSRLDPDLKKAIFEVIPKTRSQPGAAPNDGPAPERPPPAQPLQGHRHGTVAQTIVAAEQMPAAHGGNQSEEVIDVQGGQVWLQGLDAGVSGQESVIDSSRRIAGPHLE